ncbi:MAG: agmatine deiminase family protein [Ferruginibacter sp.]
MRQLLLFTCILLSATLFSQTENASSRFRHPAEWEPMEGIWIGLSDKSFLAGPSVEQGMADCIKILQNYVTVNMNVKNDSMLFIQKKLLSKNGIDTNKIRFIIHDAGVGKRGTIRDTGPGFLINDNKEILAVDFNFEGGGFRPGGTEQSKTATEKFDRELAATINIPVRKANVISQGGGRDLNGKGTLLLVEQLDMDGNKKLRKYQIEEEYKKALGVTKIIWLNRGLLEDERLDYGTIWNELYPVGSGGHIDLFCRFAGPNTILLAQITEKERVSNPIAAINYHRLEENYEILKNATDQDGKPFTIIRIPVGPHMTAKHVLTENDKYVLNLAPVKKVGDTFHYVLGTSYLNFIIANGVVITSKYWKPGRPKEFKVRDNQAVLTLQKAFPAHKIVAIDIEGYNHDGAGFHCITLNQPKVNN